MTPPVSFKSSRPVRRPGFLFFSPGLRPGAKLLVSSVSLWSANLFAQTNSPAISAPPFPEAGVSLVRVIGALALVLGLFLGGIWLFKNWQRLAMPHGRQPRLNILETRSLGSRQAVFVVGYERQRFLLSTSPAGVSLLSHLPDAEADEAPAEAAGPMPFAQALAKVLKRK